MSILSRDKNKPRPKKYPKEDLNIPKEWLDVFYELMPEGCRLNSDDNAWINEQYNAGRTPQDVSSDCVVIDF